MARFIESVLCNYLSGLFGKPVAASSFFEDSELYRDWLGKTAREVVYWTAQQRPGSDCISEHLSHKGKPASIVYPGCDNNTCYSPMDVVRKRELLGLNNDTFGLSWLVRGLGLVAGGIAEQLQAGFTEAPEP